MTDLMTHVESIVRPVRADWSKPRFRRELLAHLHASYDEERARGLDHPAAIAAASARLGDPASLTAQLQASISPFERFAVSRLPGSNLLDRLAGRYADLPALVSYGRAHRPATNPFRWPILLAAASLLPTLALLLPLPFVTGPRLPFAAGLLALECWVALVYVLWVDLIGFTAPRPWRRIAACLPAFILAGLAWYYPLTLSLTGEPSATPVPQAVQGQLAALALPALAGFLAFVLLRRPLRPWLSIDLAQ